ncbi:MAG: hypothetical protein GX537_03060 [Actinobacteria bacterium]|nr:hypothetical protein [Actinomycetota bacterium]
MEAFVQVLPAYVPEAAAAAWRVAAAKEQADVEFYTRCVRRLAERGLSEDECRARGRHGDMMDWHYLRKAQDRLAQFERFERDAAGAPARAAVAVIRCYHSYDHRAELKARGYRFGRSVPHALSLKAEAAWSREMPAGDGSALRAEIAWLKGLGARVRMRESMDLTMAVVAGDPRMVGLA